MSPAPAGRLLAWTARQVSASALVLLGASLLLFGVVRAAPGREADPGRLVVTAPQSSGEGSPAPASSGYAAWLAGAVRGDFGNSAALQRGRPVLELVAPAAARSFGLAFAALLAASAAALALAVAAVARPRSVLVRGAEGAIHLLSAVPVFLGAYAAVAAGNGLVVWGARAGWWAIPAWFPFPSRPSWVPWAAAVGVLALGDGLLLDLYRRFRAELGSASRSDFLVGIRLLSLSVPAAVARTVLPGIASHLAHKSGFVLGSLVVLESALGWPGLGHLAWRAAAERDLPVLLAVALLLAAVVRACGMAGEAVWYACDPRHRAEGR